MNGVKVYSLRVQYAFSKIASPHRAVAPILATVSDELPINLVYNKFVVNDG